MNRNLKNALVALAIPAAALLSSDASAIIMAVTPVDIRQIGTTPQVNLGHMIDARSNLPNLTVGGSFVASCISPDLAPIRDSHSESQSLLFQVNVLSVSVPEWLPATRAFAGWYNVPIGSVLACTYEWTARATDKGITITAAGVAIPTGGDEKTLGSTIPFTMVKPGTATGGSCIP